MFNPTEQKEPENCGEDKHKRGHKQSAPKQFPQARYKQTCQSRQNISARPCPLILFSVPELSFQCLLNSRRNEIAHIAVKTS